MALGNNILVILSIPSI